VEPIGTVAAGAGVVAVGGLAYSAGYEVRAYTLREVSVPVLPAGASHLRVLHLSDLHLTPAQKKKQQWLRDLARLEPDLVVVTGDFLAHTDAPRFVLDALQPLAQFPGVFVFGSNDYYGPKLKNPARYLFSDKGVRIHDDPLPWPELKAGLEKFGWVDLTHRRYITNIGGTEIEFRGVDDPHLELDDYSTVAGAVPADHLGIGVTHAPYLRVLNSMDADEIPLIFAGHTHGGQLAIPGFGALVTNCDLDRRMAKGLHRYRKAWLHVSAGLGTNPYTPVRFACRPEATLVTLTS
jgi:predicted MPP superfamily phosphohydrolase